MRIYEIKGYHGSTNDHQAFDVLHTGYNSTSFSEYTSTRHGVFFTNNPEFAALYGDVMEYDLNITNTINLNSINASNVISAFVDLMFDIDRDVALDARNVLHGHGQVWGLFEDTVGEYFVKFLKDNGYDSATFIEDHETDDGYIESDTIVVFNPSKIIKNGQYELDLYDNKRYFSVRVKK